MTRKPLRAVKIPAPPDTLSEGTAALWRDLLEARDLGTTELPVLAAGLEQLDVYERAMEQVRDEGPVVKNPDSGNPKSHPALAAAHAALRAYRQAMNHLGIEEGDEGFRPRGSLSRRGRR